MLTMLHYKMNYFTITLFTSSICIIYGRTNNGRNVEKNDFPPNSNYITFLDAAQLSHIRQEFEENKPGNGTNNDQAKKFNNVSLQRGFQPMKIPSELQAINRNVAEIAENFETDPKNNVASYHNGHTQQYYIPRQQQVIVPVSQPIVFSVPQAYKYENQASLNPTVNQPNHYSVPSVKNFVLPVPPQNLPNLEENQKEHSQSGHLKTNCDFPVTNLQQPIVLQPIKSSNSQINLKNQAFDFTNFYTGVFPNDNGYLSNSKSLNAENAQKTYEDVPAPEKSNTYNNLGFYNTDGAKLEEPLNDKYQQNFALGIDGFVNRYLQGTPNSWENIKN